MTKITLKRENVIKQVESEEQALLLELKDLNGWMQLEKSLIHLERHIRNRKP